MSQALVNTDSKIITTEVNMLENTDMADTVDTADTADTVDTVDTADTVDMADTTDTADTADSADNTLVTTSEPQIQYEVPQVQHYRKNCVYENDKLM